MSKDQLDLRKKLNKKRPRFTQADHHKKKRLNSNTWRKPKGMHGKQRHNINGKPANVSPGYRGPKAARSLDPKGLAPIIVYTLTQLDSIDAKTQCALIGKIGDKKRLAILNACKEKGIAVTNVKNIDDAIKTIKDKFETRKKTKTDLKKKRETTAKATKAKKQKEEKQNPEDVKEEQQEEMEQIVTARE